MLLARVFQSTCSDATQRKEALQPNPHSWEWGADVPGPNSGVHGRCLVREETARKQLCGGLECLYHVVSTRAYAAYFSWSWAESLVNQLDVILPLLFGLWSVRLVGDLRLVSAGGSCRRLGRALSSILCLSVPRVVGPALGGGISPAFSLVSCSWLSRWLPWPPGVGWRVVFGPPRVRRLSRRLRGACLWRFYLGPSSRYLRVAGRQVERFASCIFQAFAASSFSVLAGSLGVFLAFAAPGPGGC